MEGKTRDGPFLRFNLVKEQCAMRNYTYVYVICTIRTLVDFKYLHIMTENIFNFQIVFFKGTNLKTSAVLSRNITANKHWASFMLVPASVKE